MKFSSLKWAINDSMTMAKRNILALVRVPTSLVFAVVQPIMFVLLFRYVFGGGAIQVNIPGGYVNYLIPGILVQTTIFGSVSTAIGLAEDLEKGLIERLRALPIARMAVLTGRTISDLLRNLMILIVITGIGFAVGFRPGGGPLHYVEASAIMLAFAYCLSWGFAYIGLIAPNAEAAQAMTFPLIFPLTFASGIFVQVSSMPSWLQGFAGNQPVTMVTKAVRSLMLGTPVGNTLWVSLAWSIGVLLVLAPLTVAKFRRAT